MRIAVVARGACSALGEGEAAFAAGRPLERPVSRVKRDDELTAAGLTRPFVARAPITAPPGEDRAAVLLERALRGCTRELDEVDPSWRARRVGFAIGTSSGGMRSFEAWTRGAPADPRHVTSATYIGPVATALARVPLTHDGGLAPVACVLAACASSTIAIGLARAWLLEDRCDIALCGGYDAVSVFVAAGFESLRATCTDRGPLPFRVGRDGLALGEGAAVIALTSRDEEPASRAHAFVTGFGVTCDATHLTAPDPKGEGLARAAKHALAEAGQASVDLVSAHGTATLQNDASEAHAIARSFQREVAPPKMETTRSIDPTPPVFGFKGVIGHTLGAAGALELLAATDAMARQVIPGSVGEGEVEEGVVLVDETRPAATPIACALKLSSAFGGVNAALVLERDPKGAAAQAWRPAFASHAVLVHVSDDETSPAILEQRTGYGQDRIARADDLVRLSLAAIAKLVREGGVDLGASRDRTGVIVGLGLATIETNERFQARIASAGAARAEPRRFPYTTPNAAAGECAVAFSLRGPAFAVGGGPHGGIEALAVAADLVRTRGADRILVIATDEVGEASRRYLGEPGPSGAIALLVSADAREGHFEIAIESCAFASAAPAGLVPAPRLGYEGLLPLVRDHGNSEARGGELRVPSTRNLPLGAFAKLSIKST